MTVQGADLSDVLMDRAVINGANLTNANLSRAVFTRYPLDYHAATGSCSSLQIQLNTFCMHAL